MIRVSVIPNWQYVVAAGVIIALIGLWQWAAFRTEAYKFMLHAKAQAKDGILKSGQEQEDKVVQLLNAVPYLCVIPSDVKRIAVKYLYGIAKDLADNGVLDNSL